MKKQLELIEEYLYYGRKQRKLDEKTICAYRIDLKQFSEFNGQEELVMSREAIRKYILHLHDVYKQKDSKAEDCKFESILLVFRGRRDYRRQPNAKGADGIS